MAAGRGVRTERTRRTGGGAASARPGGRRSRRPLCMCGWASTCLRLYVLFEQFYSVPGLNTARIHYLQACLLP